MGLAWIQTYSNQRFELENPRPEQIELRDIAHALSLICRFGGHTERMYSVAQHSVLVASLCPPELRMEALFHDAAEAYLGDIVTPLKRLLGPAYTELTDRVERAIADRFGLQWPIPDLVHQADKMALAIEKRDLRKKIAVCDWSQWDLPAPPDGLRLTASTSICAEIEFLEAFECYSKTKADQFHPMTLATSHI